MRAATECGARIVAKELAACCIYHTRIKAASTQLTYAVSSLAKTASISSLTVALVPALHDSLVAAICLFDSSLGFSESAWEVGRIHGSIDCFSNIGHSTFKPTSAPLCYSCASSSRMTCVADLISLLPFPRAHSSFVVHAIRVLGHVIIARSSEFLLNNIAHVRKVLETFLENFENADVIPCLYSQVHDGF